MLINLPYNTYRQVPLLNIQLKTNKTEYDVKTKILQEVDVPSYADLNYNGTYENAIYLTENVSPDKRF